MAKGNVDAGNFFVLQDVANDAGAGGVGADRELADAIAVFVGAGVGAKIVAQILVLGAQVHDAIVFHLDRERARLEIAVALAEIIADHAVHDEDAVRVHGRGENFAARQVAPFFPGNNAARLEPIQFRRKLGDELGAAGRLAGHAFCLAHAFDEALAEFVHL